MEGFLDKALSDVLPKNKAKETEKASEVQAPKKTLMIVRRTKPEVSEPVKSAELEGQKNNQELKKLEQEARDEFVNFIFYSYLPPLKIPADYLLALAQEVDEKKRGYLVHELEKSEQRASWEKYRATYFAELAKLNKKYGYIDPFDSAVKDKQPVSKEIQRYLLELNALGEYENVFVPDENRNFDQRLTRAMSYLLLVQKDGPLAILKRVKETDPQTKEVKDKYIGVHDYHLSAAFNDILFLCQQRGLINDDPKYTEYRQKLLQHTIATMGEAHGKENEYRSIYIAQFAGDIDVHSTPFQDHEESERKDVVKFIFQDADPKVRIVFIQTKSHEYIEGGVKIPDDTKDVYDLIISSTDEIKKERVAKNWVKRFDQAVEKQTDQDIKNLG